MSNDAVGRRWWTGLGVLLVLLFLALGTVLLLHRRAPQPEAHGGLTALTVGDQRGGTQALLRAAGELDNVPYPIEWALFPAASPLLEALNSGAVDVGGIGGQPFAFAYAGGAKIKVVAAYRHISGHGTRISAIIVPKTSPLRSWADIKGKRIATVRGSAGQDLALQLLERHGLGARDVQWVYLNNSDARAALKTGSIDAWSTWASYVGTALVHGGDRAFADARELPAEAGFYAASDRAITTKRAQIQDLVQRLARARSWVQSHRAEYARILAKETGLPLDVAQFTAEAYQYRAVPIDKQIADGQREILERYRRAGLIASVPNLDGAFDPSFNGKS